MDLDIDGSAYGHELLWKANTTGTNYEESVVAYVGGVAYIGSCSTHGQGHDKLFAVDCTNGNILWSTHTGPGYAGPVIDGNALYMGSCSHGNNPTNDFMYSIDRITGTPNWSKNIYTGVPVPVQFDANNMYLCTFSQGAKVHALDKLSSSTIWTYDSGLGYCANIPMLKGNAVYAAFSHPGGKMVKLNAANGSVIWSKSLPAGPWDNSITADGLGRIFLAAYYGSTMNAYNEADGTLLWTYPLHGRPLSFNGYHNGVVFIADTDGYVYALNAASGQLIWENKIGGTVDISSPTLSGGLLFIGTRDFATGAFFALDEATGDTLWKYEIGASVTAAPSIADGMMLCGADDWYLYAFDFGVGSGDWLLHRYDRLNTAYSPQGLTTWQYVEAVCVTSNNRTMCRVTNRYDHDVTEIRLRAGFRAYWYDSAGGLLKPDSDNYMIDDLSSLASMDLVISRQPLNWKLLSPGVSPPPRHSHAMAADSARQRIVLFGGDDGTYLDDTWEWDGTTWASASPTTRPRVRHNHAMAYDATRRRVVLFGGFDGSGGGVGHLGDTWTWNGANWQQELPAPSPLNRSAHAMVYDAARQEVVLFGGASSAGRLGDTWIWDGLIWRQASPTTYPSARSGHAMAYDAVRQRVVLFGGEGGAFVLEQDTWEWDGVNWTQATPSQSPIARSAHAMAYDSSRQRVLVFGGRGRNADLDDTWEWSGTTWAQIATTAPPARRHHAMAYDSARQVVALFGGDPLGAPSDDTWEYSSLFPASFTTYGTGCPSSMGDPTLAAAPYSSPWTGDTFSVELGNLPAGSFPFMMLGFTRASTPIPQLPGCTQLTSADSAVGLTLTGNVATWSQIVPVNPALVGWSLFLQGAALNAGGASPLGAALSSGGQATIGMR